MPVLQPGSDQSGPKSRERAMMSGIGLKLAGNSFLINNLKAASKVYSQK